MLKHKIKKFDNILGVHLNLTAANGTKIPHQCFVELIVKFRNNQNFELGVPFLVIQQKLELPILGYNVIEEFLRRSSASRAKMETMKTLFTDLAAKGSKILIYLITEEESQDIHFSTVKVAKKECMLPKGKSVNLTCRAYYFLMDSKTQVLFEPIESSNLPKGLQITENLTVVNRGKSCRLKAEVINISAYDIVIPNIQR